ncbi:MAG: potassium channel family protein [Acidobacteriota bacterium]
MQAPVSVLALAVGIALILGVLWDAFETAVLSRRVSRGTRLTTLFYRLTWPTWRVLAARMRSERRRENFLTVFGPLSLLLLIAFWAFGLVLGFALLHWGAGTQMRTPDGRENFFVDLYMSGTTLFTLGIGDVTPTSASGRAITVLESGMGLGFLALMISYLPVLSQAFSNREVSISLLDARAGSPPSGSELLRRHSRDGESALEPLLREWERSSAQLLESHVSFPVLAYYRSQHDNQSWVAAMTAILDTCALIIAIVEHGPVRQARLTFAMARHAVADLCHVLDLDPQPPRPDRLDPAVLALVRASLRDSGIALQPEQASERRLDELRRMYEPQVHALSRRLLMPLPPWIPGIAVHENWNATAPER